MNRSKFSGLANLRAKSMSIIAVALSSLLNSDTQAQELPQNNEDKSKSINFTEYEAKKSKPQLILKLNSADHMNSKILAFHRSHSSHSSHRSHSSHSSHSSHYSSSYSPGSGSSYTPPTPAYTPPAPTYSPAPKTTKSAPETSENSSQSSYTYPSNDNSNFNVPILYNLGDRELYKGCEGADVKVLQQLLLQLNYDVVVSEYFGDKTELAVIQFQKRHELKPTGRVDSKVLSKIKSSL